MIEKILIFYAISYFITIIYLCIKAIIKLRKNDPVYNCEFYKENGCAFVDNPLCDFPDCIIRKEFIENNVK